MQRKLLEIKHIYIYIYSGFQRNWATPVVYSAFVVYFKKMEIQLGSASAVYRLPRNYMSQLGGRSCLIFSLSLVSL